MSEHWLSIIDSLELPAEKAGVVRELVIREAERAYAAGRRAVAKCGCRGCAA